MLPGKCGMWSTGPAWAAIDEGRTAGADVAALGADI
jgi:hypothetical protein